MYSSRDGVSYNCEGIDKFNEYYIFVVKKTFTISKRTNDFDE